MPLQDFSKGAAHTYFADGVTEALITELAQVKGLQVTSRTSSMAYKATTKSLPEIARELGVDLILEGSVVQDRDAGAGHRAVDRCRHGSASLGPQLRSPDPKSVAGPGRGSEANCHGHQNPACAVDFGRRPSPAQDASPAKSSLPPLTLVQDGHVDVIMVTSTVIPTHMYKRRLAALAAALASSVLLWNCGGSSPASPSPGGGGGGGGGSIPPPPAAARADSRRGGRRGMRLRRH